MVVLVIRTWDPAPCAQEVQTHISPTSTVVAWTEGAEWEANCCCSGQPGPSHGRCYKLPQPEEGRTSRNPALAALGMVAMVQLCRVKASLSPLRQGFSSVIMTSSTDWCGYNLTCNCVESHLLHSLAKGETQRYEFISSHGLFTSVFKAKTIESLRDL